MSEMIERVAQAICGDDNPSNVLEIHRVRARAAIKAMLQPTDHMIKATQLHPKGPLAWQAMIYAALDDRP